MGRANQLTFSRFVTLPENRTALEAVRGLVGSRKPNLPSLLYLHGGPGSGKTHLAWALTAELMRQEPTATASVIPAAELSKDDVDSDLEMADLLIIEDLQHLPKQACSLLTEVLDFRLEHSLPTLVTALVGPAALPELPGRLISRLAAGVVVRIQPLSGPSRKRLLEELIKARNLAITPDAVTWIAEHTPGGARQLHGIVHRLVLLARTRRDAIDLITTTDLLEHELDGNGPTLERIAEQVGGHFHVDPRQMRSSRRSRVTVLPRQVSMYLARLLTKLSLQEIGSWFGGRDHSTVLHACKKVQQGLKRDLVLQGTVSQLQAELV